MQYLQEIVAHVKCNRTVISRKLTI